MAVNNELFVAAAADLGLEHTLVKRCFDRVMEHAAVKYNDGHDNIRIGSWFAIGTVTRRAARSRKIKRIPILYYKDSWRFAIKFKRKSCLALTVPILTTPTPPPTPMATLGSLEKQHLYVIGFKASDFFDTR